MRRETTACQRCRLIGDVLNAWPPDAARTLGDVVYEQDGDAGGFLRLPDGGSHRTDCAECTARFWLIEGLMKVDPVICGQAADAGPHRVVEFLNRLGLVTAGE